MGTHKAWIPNVSGNISFSNIKGQSIPGRAKSPLTFNELGKVKRSIHSLQIRNLSDAIYAALDPGGQLQFLLIAKIETDSSCEILCGEILIYPEQELTPEDKVQLKCFKKPVLDERAISTLAKDWKNKDATIIINFELTRDGFAKFVYSGSNTKDESSFVLESYSFLKDLVHSHKFHRHDDDAIVVPYKVDSEQDTKWVTSTIRNIHKSIVSTYRNTNYGNDLINALGRLSYLESLQTIAEKKLSVTPPINVATLRTSLETRLISISEKENRKTIFFQFSIPIILSLAAILITMAQLLQVPCIDGLSAGSSCKQDGVPFAFKLSGNSIHIVQSLLTNWGNIAVGLPFVTVFLVIYLYTPSVNRWLSHQWGYGLIGWFLRSTFSIAASDKFGRVLATAWVLMFLAVIGFLLFAAMGFLHN